MYICLVFLLAFFDENKCALRIIGGEDANKHELPYVASFEILIYEAIDKYYRNSLCTCAILTPNWTLTAAHCTENTYLRSSSSSSSAEEYTSIRLVVRYTSAHKTNLSDVISVINHPAYKDKFLGHPALHLKETVNDICLLHTEPIQIKQYGKLSAIDYAALTGLEATAVGFGLVNYTSNPHKVKPALNLKNRPLKVLKVVVVKCTKPMAGLLYPSICLVRKCGQKAMICPGDSGGPLLHTSGVIGINSKGLINCKTDRRERDRTVISAGITVISPFIEWIQREIRQKT